MHLLQKNTKYIFSLKKIFYFNKNEIKTKCLFYIIDIQPRIENKDFCRNYSQKYLDVKIASRNSRGLNVGDSAHVYRQSDVSLTLTTRSLNDQASRKHESREERCGRSICRAL